MALARYLVDSKALIKDLTLISRSFFSIGIVYESSSFASSQLCKITAYLTPW